MSHLSGLLGHLGYSSDRSGREMAARPKAMRPIPQEPIFVCRGGGSHRHPDGFEVSHPFQSANPPVPKHARATTTDATAGPSDGATASH